MPYLFPNVKFKGRYSRRDEVKLVVSWPEKKENLMTDPIADMLTQIRNALMRKHRGILLPHSNLKGELARILKEENLIRDYTVVEETDKKKALKIWLKYVGKEEPVINGLKRISKPGRRVYVGWDLVPLVKGGLGVSILSTSKGLMTNKSSRAMKVGGELLCSIW